MVQDIHLYVPEHLLDDAERLVPVLKHDPALAVMGRVNRSVVLRLALQEGLAVLKQRYASAPNS
jgi:hypothetical protein